MKKNKKVILNGRIFLITNDHVALSIEANEEK